MVIPGGGGVIFQRGDLGLGRFDRRGGGCWRPRELGKSSGPPVSGNAQSRQFPGSKPWDRQPVSGKLRRKLGVSPGFAAHADARDCSSLVRMVAHSTAKDTEIGRAHV